MPTIHLNLNEPAWPDLADRADLIHLQSDLSMSALAHGMESGAPSVAFRFDLPDGTPVVAETSLAAIAGAVRGIAARLQPGLFDAPPPTAEVLVMSLSALLSMLPRKFGVATSTGPDGKGGLVTVATVVDYDADPVIPILTSMDPSFVGALRALQALVEENLAQHVAEGHDGPLH